MTTIPHEPTFAGKSPSWSARLLVPEMWASLAIVAMWMSVLFTAIFGPNIETHGAGGDSSLVPSAVAVALFASLGTWAVARNGFRHDRSR
jgi:hypothetical protein